MANVLATKTYTTAEQIAQGIALFYHAKLQIFPLSETLLITSTALAKEYTVSVYDMIYAAIAQELRCAFITADRRFAKKTMFPFVRLVGQE